MPVPDPRKVRLLMWGGAATPADNAAFASALANVLRDYQAADHGEFDFVEQRLRVATDIVALINAQADDSIRSVDIWTPGGPHALCLAAAPPQSSRRSGWTGRMLRWAQRLPSRDACLYRSALRRALHRAAWVEGSALVRDIQFSRFTSDAKVELHGCRTVEAPTDRHNIAADISLRLSRAGKGSAICIGHADRAHPHIMGGAVALPQQDYRHGLRIVFNDGEPLKASTEKGALPEPRAPR
jgi:hypothetical protein